MALVLTIGGNDRTSVLKDESLIIEHRAEGFVSVCSLALLDADSDIAIIEEDAITVVDGATTFFSGRVVEVYYDTLTTHSRRIHIKCQDLNAQLGEVVVDQEETFSAEADADIIDSLFDDYLPAVDSETHVDTIQDPMTIVLGPCTLRGALSQICTRSGGYYYVDFSNKLHYFSDEANTSAWWLSDDPDQVDSFSYFATPHKTSLAITRLDGVFVRGAGVSGWRGSHGVGDRTAIVTDNRITTSTGVEERGDAILAKYGSAQEIYYVKTFKVGLVAGMEVRFICAIYGVDDTFTVRQITVKWNASKTAFYELQLGAVVSPSLIGERLWIDVLKESVGPVSAPRLPTSSKGWSHSLVFSATDNDTVAWAAGGNIYLADGTTYAIDAGNTDDPGAMAAVTYVFLDLDTSETVLQLTDDSSVAVGTKKILVAVCTPVGAGLEATFMAFGGDGQNVLVDTDNIVAEAVTAAKILAGTITANEIAANTILAGNIAAGAIETDELDALAVTAAKIAAGVITADKFHIGVGKQLFTQDDGLLLLGPWCPLLPGSWQSLRGQAATLTGAFHTVAGRWAGTQALMVEEAVTNRFENPSFEVDTTGWIIQGAGTTIARSGDCAAFGDYSCKIVTADAAAIEGMRTVVTAVTAAGAAYTISAYGKGSGTIRIRTYDDVSGFQEGADWILDGTLRRHSSSFVFGIGSTVRFVYFVTVVQQDITFYIDAAQLQTGLWTTSYVDGSLSWGTWTGAAHGSTSTRVATEVNLNTYAPLLSDNDTFSILIQWQPQYDADANWPDPAYLFDVRGADNANRSSIEFDDDDDKYNIYINGDWRMQSSAQTFDAGEWQHVLLTVDYASNSYVLYVNGVADGSDTTALAAITVTQMNLGADFVGASIANAAYSELAILDSVLTTVEVAAIYQSQYPITDMGAIDTPGIYILDGKFKIASSASGQRIEIVAEEIAGYSSAGVKQFYLSSADGKAYAGAGAVILDANGISIGQGTSNFNAVKWYSGANFVGSVVSHWAGGGGDAIFTTILADNSNIAGAHARVTLKAVDGAVDVRLNLDTNKTLGGTGVETFQLESGALNWVNLNKGGDMTLDIITAGHFYIKNNAVGTTILDVTGDGAVKILNGLLVGIVGAVDYRSIACDGTIRTEEGNKWNLGGVNTGTITPDRKIGVEIDGQFYTLAAQLGLV